ncbi:hypothetical protein NEF87_004848 [Candidatus Lokiarchaeum ossiferum]|uniref:DUF1512 domain-containing protein n=1 Tax=Candidatus Lokiarchaeum ossiferum TaxID=2951803 RepID=A0ABY6HYF0_9ARCH|nr:hypothetical protein NEF87_004848 [Candidatus Lokiarchaeum sp. B-35]
MWILFPFLIILVIIGLAGLLDPSILIQPELITASIIFNFIFTLCIFRLAHVNNKCLKGYRNIKNIIENNISEIRREVVNLRYIEKMDPGEISEILDNWYKFYNALYFDGELSPLNSIIKDFNVLFFPIDRISSIITTFQKLNSRLKLLDCSDDSNQNSKIFRNTLEKINIFKEELEFDLAMLKSNKVEKRARLNSTQIIITLISSCIVSIITVLTIRKYGI